MRMIKSWGIALLLAVALVVAGAPAQARICEDGQSSNGPMWLSILHPGLGEWALKGWGPFENAPQRKFWLGFIPGFGWPGYLQVKSAIDVANCRTHDEIWMSE